MWVEGCLLALLSNWGVGRWLGEDLHLYGCLTTLVSWKLRLSILKSLCMTWYFGWGAIVNQGNMTEHGNGKLPFISLVYQSDFQSCIGTMKVFTFKWLLGNVSKIEGISALPQISPIPTGISWGSPLCAGTCLWVWLLKRAGGWHSVPSSLFHVLLLLRPGLEKAGHSA